MLDALLELMQADYRSQDMAWAKEIADALLAHFEDGDAGGFYFTSHDHEALILRTRTAIDQAMPAGAGVAARSLAHLGLILDEPRYARAAKRTLACHGDELAAMPIAFTSLMMALAEERKAPGLLVVRGPQQALSEWKALAPRHSPATLMFFLPGSLADLPASLDKPVPDEASAWLCRGGTCLPPVRNPADLEF
jgi:uncharacterized protein YyaL (SSP411 family)